jgi:hypothetical protein
VIRAVVPDFIQPENSAVLVFGERLIAVPAIDAFPLSRFGKVVEERHG